MSAFGWVLFLVSKWAQKGDMTEGTTHCNELWNLPGIKQCPIQECSVVMVPHKIGHLDSPRTAGRLEIRLNLNLVFRIPNIHQEYIKMKYRVWRDHTSWKLKWVHTESLPPLGDTEIPRKPLSNSYFLQGESLPPGGRKQAQQTGKANEKLQDFLGFSPKLQSVNSG